MLRWRSSHILLKLSSILSSQTKLNQTPRKQSHRDLILIGALTLRLSQQEQEVAKAVASVVGWFPSLTGLVIGPGLGRDETGSLCAKGVIEAAKGRHLPLVIDGVCAPS